MKGLKDGPVETYLFREYPSTLEAAITLAMQEEFSLRQAKLHVNVPLPPEPAVEVVDEEEGPEPMDLSSATAAGQQWTRTNVRCFRCGNIGHYAQLLVLDLDDKFDMVLGMPWLARHDSIIDGENRTVVCFGHRGATESDGPVSAADTPNGASEPPSETVAPPAGSSPVVARGARGL
ncbi:RNA-dependent DNA polymerase [Phytophthora megakarya]|uniref:RNA-dependent DNA polymerase n=1 Tax=Phytophthora megakarya TaxID=4795 RepID=A0A225UTG3_9STRA|nr:RNA-dependent DNA polymerase [Phytophthora megakarya]